MKKLIKLAIVVTIMTFVSCKDNTPNQPYQYELNPDYTWGYVVFYGDYYADYLNANNVLTVNLFTDSLKINDQNELSGYGQYLFLEDVFVAPSDTLLPEGIYRVEKSGEPFTIAPGINDTIDNQVYTLGAVINYYESNPLKSTQKLIVGGTMTVSRHGENFSLNCDFVLQDSLKLKGNFSGMLPHFDESLQRNEKNSVIKNQKRGFQLMKVYMSKYNLSN
jgi:hypothetical protein